MAKLDKGHYHCIECDTLYEAAVVKLSDQRCPACGNPPSGRVLSGGGKDYKVLSASDPHGVSEDTKDINEAAVKAQKKKNHGKVKRTKRKSKKSSKVIAFITLWLVLMIATILIVKHFSSADDEAVAQFEVEKEREKKRIAYEEQMKRAIVKQALPECQQAITDFFMASSPAAKAQRVYQGAKLSGIMSRYYRNNPTFSSTRSMIQIMWANSLEFEGKLVIGAICRNSVNENFEVVFVKSKNEWKIDWLSLVRFDPAPWALFQIGEDGDEGVFRLYMRVRDSNKDLDQQEMSIVFYKPNIFTKGDYSELASPSVSVKLASPIGSKILNMVDREESVEDEMGYPTGKIDPPGYHRVRVRVKLHKRKKFAPDIELLEIIDSHWYGIDQVEQGTELESAP